MRSAALTLIYRLWFHTIAFPCCLLVLVYLNVTLPCSDSGGSPYLFDDRGRLSQVELAFTASSQGSTALAIRSHDTCAILSWSDRGSLLTDSTNIFKKQRIKKINENTGVLICGVSSDARFLTTKLFEAAIEHQFLFNSDIPPKRLASRLATWVHQRTLSSRYRPYGVRSCFIAFDRRTDNTCLLEVDTFGGVHECYVTCLGKYADKLLGHLHCSVNDLRSTELSTAGLINKLFGMLRSFLQSDRALDEFQSDSSREVIRAEDIEVALVGRHLPLSILTNSKLEELVTNGYLNDLGAQDQLLSAYLEPLAD